MDMADLIHMCGVFDVELTHFTQTLPTLSTVIIASPSSCDRDEGILVRDEVSYCEIELLKNKHNVT